MQNIAVCLLFSWFDGGKVKSRGKLNSVKIAPVSHTDPVHQEPKRGAVAPRSRSEGLLREFPVR